MWEIKFNKNYNRLLSRKSGQNEKSKNKISKNTKNKTNTKKSKKSILIVGLPGIGNVSKIVVDYISGSIDAKEILTFESNSLQPLVLISDKSLLELPKLFISLKETLKYKLYFLQGDIQPYESKSSFDFANKVLEFCIDERISEIITLGGIGLKETPTNPKIYITSAKSKYLLKWKKRFNNKLNYNLFGNVIHIMGMAGLLPIIASKKDIPSVAILGETYNNPIFVGINTSEKMIKLISRMYDLKLKMNDWNKDVLDIEKEILMIHKNKDSKEINYDLNYIG